MTNESRLSSSSLAPAPRCRVPGRSAISRAVRRAGFGKPARDAPARAAKIPLESRPAVPRGLRKSCDRSRASESVPRPTLVAAPGRRPRVFLTGMNPRRFRSRIRRAELSRALRRIARCARASRPRAELARRSQLAQSIRRGKPGDSAADYRNPLDLWGAARLEALPRMIDQRECAATIDAIISIINGWSPTVGARSILISASRAT